MKILVFPKDINPYQKLLYSSMKNTVTVAYFQNMRKPRIVNMILTPFELGYFRLKGYKILHLHWFFPFSFSNRNQFLISLSQFYFHVFLYFLKLYGYKLVWTVHDLTPHEKTFHNDLKISELLANAADALIVLNNETKSVLMDWFKISGEKIKHVALGNYIDYYKDSSSTTKDKETFDFLFFGQIKPYKGVDRLIEDFKKSANSNSRLIIAGKCRDNGYVGLLNTIIGDDDRISFNNDYVPEENVAGILRNSDVVVLPFTNVTNSSSAILAFSMKKPIIAPRIGMIKDFPEDTGIYYDQNNNIGLKKAMMYAQQSKDRLEALSRKAYAYAKSLDWSTIASNTQRVYASLLT